MEEKRRTRQGERERGERERKSERVGNLSTSTDFQENCYDPVSKKLTSIDVVIVPLLMILLSIY